MSQLKHFKVEAVYDDGTGDLRCPRSECRGVFTINRKKFKGSRDSTIATRPCPYCFKASVIPGREVGDRGPWPPASAARGMNENS